MSPNSLVRDTLWNGRKVRGKNLIINIKCVNNSWAMHSSRRYETKWKRELILTLGSTWRIMDFRDLAMKSQGRHSGIGPYSLRRGSPDLDAPHGPPPSPSRLHPRPDRPREATPIDSSGTLPIHHSSPRSPSVAGTFLPTSFPHFFPLTESGKTRGVICTWTVQSWLFSLRKKIRLKFPYQWSSITHDNMYSYIDCSKSRETRYNFKRKIGEGLLLNLFERET